MEEENRKILINNEIEQRTRFVELHDSMGDGLISRINERIQQLTEQEQKIVFGIIGSYQQSVLVDVSFKKEMLIELKNIPVEVVYRVWRYLEQLN
ncbi:hypothetical protein KM1_112400 [Entamoeba histolytica HM-3:IMSS]|uniref:Uncharacterized protein n=1 Tax=Entamoeba histolytica HM-3:IMSS TaxID=885315 RepID=M7W6Y9_ENTHI|nr:hypothetical protein KM1_112400 [Entamoeba histolytica HM-3:IMSS]